MAIRDQDRPTEAEAWSVERSLGLRDLFLLFLRIGSVAFGGYLAIIAMIERELAERRGVVRHRVMLDAMALATTLPGPAAVNATAYLGYYLRGLAGALVSVLGLILPSFFLMVGFGAWYQRFGDLEAVSRVFSGFAPAVVAIVVCVAMQLAKIAVEVPVQGMIVVMAAGVFLVRGGFLAVIGLIVVSAVLGIIFLRRQARKSTPTAGETTEVVQPIAPVLILSGSLVAGTVVLHLIGCKLPLASLWVGFSEMSLLMFGGGYVSIPVMKAVVVDQHNWLGAKEFADAISLGQITPGPILISAAFIGFIVASLIGALVSTLGMFLPPALLVILCSNLHQRVAQSLWVEAAFLGIRPCVVGLIVSAAYVLGKGCEPSLVSGGIFGGALIATLRYKVNSLYVVPVAGLLGYLGHLFRM